MTTYTSPTEPNLIAAHLITFKYAFIFFQKKLEKQYKKRSNCGGTRELFNALGVHGSKEVKNHRV